MIEIISKSRINNIRLDANRDELLTNLPTYNKPLERKQLPDNLYLIPYIGLNILKLGCNKEDVHQILGRPLYSGQRKTGAFEKGAYIEDYNNLNLRYDDDVLTEIHLSDMPNIYYEGINLVTKKAISELEKSYNIVPKGSYSVIPELGITLGKDELFIYSERIKDLWLNSKRPITSW